MLYSFVSRFIRNIVSSLVRFGWLVILAFIVHRWNCDFKNLLFVYNIKLDLLLKINRHYLELNFKISNLFKYNNSDTKKIINNIINKQ